MIGKTFRFLTDEDIRLIARDARTLHYKRSECVVNEGERVHGLFFIKDGSAQVLKISHDDETVIAILTKEDVFGEMSFIDDSRASATVKADESLEILFLDGLYVHSLLESVPGLSSRFYHSVAVLLADRLRATTQVASFTYSWG